MNLGQPRAESAAAVGLTLALLGRHARRVV